MKISSPANEPFAAGLTINSGAAELARWDLVLEQQVDFTERSVLRLGQSEPTPEEAKEVCAGVEEGGLCAPIPGGGRDHPGGDGVGDDAGDVVDDSLSVDVRWLVRASAGAFQSRLTPIVIVFARSRPEGVSATMG